MPSDPRALLRSRAYVRLLVVAAILGVPVSAAAYGFLALVNYLQQEIFSHLPHGLGFRGEPWWWPLPVLALGGLLTGLTIRYLPGTAGARPAEGFKVHKAPTPADLPGVILAALATLVFGAVLGPEAPLIAIGGGLVVLALRAARRRPSREGRRGASLRGQFRRHQHAVRLAHSRRVPADGGVRAQRSDDGGRAGARPARLGHRLARLRRS